MLPASQPHRWPQWPQQPLQQENLQYLPPQAQGLQTQQSRPLRQPEHAVQPPVHPGSVYYRAELCKRRPKYRQLTIDCKS
jgi:hypothetical protein